MGIRQALLILSFTTLSCAQDLTGKVDRLANYYKFSGALLIAKGGKILINRAFGMANQEWSIPNTPDTVFRLASISKQFGAAAILKLEEMGKLKTTDKACNYLPACPEVWKPITIHHLLTHTSGIPDFTNLPDYEKLQILPSRYEQQVKSVWDEKMDFHPGTRFSYSNTGYVILGQIIERASGQPWEQFLAEQIFAPAGMTQTRADSSTTIVPMRASGYKSPEGKTLNADYINMQVPSVAGALLSTTSDLFKWDRALASATILSPASIEKMFTPDKEDYAYGWVITKRAGKTIQGHDGGIDGFSTSLLRIPSDGTLIVVLSNFEDGKTEEVRRGLLTLANGGTVRYPKIRPEIQLPSETLDEYLGTYQLSPTFALTITREGDQLITQATGQGKIPVFVEAKDILFPKAMPATLQILRENGKVTGLILKQGGREMKATKN
jgi:CubicO group peptidase (beta-lactamase class C family)